MKALAKRKLVSPADALICGLEEADRVPGCGAKAANLARILQLRIHTPPGLVITDKAFQSFLDAETLRPFVAEQTGKLDLHRPQSAQEISALIRQRVLAARPPVVVWDALVERLAEVLSGVTLIVRSSALGEDGNRSSFAGQLDSILHVDSESALQEALLACWASFWSPRALFYQKSRGIELGGMGVIVQAEVAARAAGVLFTRGVEGDNPENECVLEFCRGQADALVGGRLNPGRCRVRRTTGEILSRVPDEQGFEPSPEEVDELVQIGATLEEAFGAPQDVEWCIGPDGRLEIVQARPITVQARSGSQRQACEAGPMYFPPQIAAAPGKSIYWTNANVNENFPEPITPFLYSIAADGYYHYFRNLGVAFGVARRRLDAMEQPLRQLIGVHGGRMYYNLTNLHAVLREAPFGARLVDFFNRFVGATELASDERRRRNGFVEGLEAGRVVLSAGWQFLFLKRRVAQFERIVNEFAKSARPEYLSKRSPGELRDLLRGFLDIRCRRWKDASLADAAAMISYGLLGRFLKREFPERELAGLHNTLLKGLRCLVSSEPTTGLWRLSRLLRTNSAWRTAFEERTSEALLTAIRTDPSWLPFREALDAELNHWGFRCSGELLLTRPSYQEEPAQLIDVLRAYLALEGSSPHVKLEEQEAARRSETARILKLLHRRWLLRWLPWPRKAGLASRLLAWTQGAIALRERARLKQALLYHCCRRIALAIGERLGDSFARPEDLFFLTHQELAALLAGTFMFPYHVRELVALRRKAHDELTHMRPPDDFAAPQGAYLAPGPMTEPDRSRPIDKDALTGIGACGGQATGRATILHEVREAERLTRGDVLIARQTDPAWAPIFFLIKGLVLERGGMLSHGAILAREYGIPTVVGVARVTERLRSGQLVQVDGDRGSVEVLGE
jgi:rifampicin phosphotransferase